MSKNNYETISNSSKLQFSPQKRTGLLYSKRTRVFILSVVKPVCYRHCFFTA